MFKFFRRKPKVVESPLKKVPLFEERFTLTEFKVIAHHLDNIEVDETLIENVINTLITPLIAYIEKLGEKPSDQQKAMLELLKQLKVKIGRAHV